MPYMARGQSAKLLYFKDTESTIKSIEKHHENENHFVMPFWTCHSQCHLLSSLLLELDFSWNLKARHLTRDRVVFCMSTEKRNTRIEKVRRPNKCEQMCTKFREEGFGQFTTFSCHYPVGGPRFPVNLKESHTRVVTIIIIGILNRYMVNIFVCVCVLCQNPILYFVKKGNDEPIQLDCEIPEDRIRKGTERVTVWGWSWNDQEWIMFYCFGIPP